MSYIVLVASIGGYLGSYFIMKSAPPRIFVLPNDSIPIYVLILCILGCVVAVKYSNKSGFFKRGLEAERLVTKHLQNLDDNYVLINDYKLPNRYGNIDHVLLGPNGIFAIETKDFEGIMRCSGDNWYQYKHQWVISQEYERKSFSKQAKRNALSLKRIIEIKSRP